MVDIVNGEADALTDEEIYNQLAQALLDEGDYDTSDGSVIDSLLTALSLVLASEQEQGLVDVYRNAFLDTATDGSLENVVSVIGLSRQSAINATGTVTFDHDNATDSTYTIPNGTTVETKDGIGFQTSEEVSIPYWDGFEGTDPIADYSGDTGSVEISSTYAQSGSNSLHFTGAGNIWLDGGESSRGMKHHAHVYFDSGDGGTQQATLRVMGEANNLAAGNDLVINADNDEIAFESGSFVSATIPSDEWLELAVTPNLDGSIEATLTDSSDNQITTVSASAPPKYPDIVDHDGTIGFGANSSAVYWDEASASHVAADIRAVSGGPSGNLGPKVIQVLPSTVNGVNDVYNRQATGDSDNFDTDGERLIAGSPEETDTELRERARRVSGDGGAATIDALLGSVLDVDGVTSARIFENDTDTDNTGSGGLPPTSFEVVAGGGSDNDVATALFEEKAATARDYGGANGTDTSATVSAVNEQSFTINFSRPTVIDVNPTLDIVINGDYAGDRAVRRTVTDYIGGIGVDGEDVSGLSAGEDVIINELEARVHDIEGVIGVDSSDSSYTPSTTTDSNGLEVIAIGDNEVSETDATDGSITISTTEI